MSTKPLVVGAVIVDRFPQPTSFLAARRTRPANLAGQWEFPGGKVEDGESPEAAVVREISEELSLDVSVVAEMAHPAEQTWPASNGYRMRLFFCLVGDGELLLTDGHDEARWLGVDELSSVAWLESDREAVRILLG